MALNSTQSWEMQIYHEDVGHEVQDFHKFTLNCKNDVKIVRKNKLPCAVATSLNYFSAAPYY